MLGLVMPPLPLTRELHELIPILAHVLRSKSLDASNLVVSDLDRQIRLAHECVSQEVDAVADMRW